MHSSRLNLNKALTIVRGHIERAIFLIFSFAALLYFDGNAGGLVATFFPFVFIIGGSGGDGGGGGGGGDSGGGEGSCSGEAGEASSGCGNAAGSDGSVIGSTPFLCTWNGEKFVYENDFLFGNPTSLVRNAEEGMELYENKTIIPDLYRLQNDVRLKDGCFIAQIREIEPEESFIDHFSLLRVVYPRSTEIIVDSKLQHVHAFEKGALETLEGVTRQNITLNGTDVSSTVGNQKNLFAKTHDQDGYFISAGDDVIEIRGRVENKNNNVYLLLRAHYRDWTLGEIFNTAKARQYIPANEFFKTSPKILVKGLFLFVPIAILSAVTAVGSLLRSGTPDVVMQEAEKLARSFKIPRAHADIPPPPPPPGRSLVVEYWNGATFEKTEVFSSIRYYQPSLNTIAIPAKAIQSSGDVRLRITATHRHKIHFAGLVAPRKHPAVRTERFSVKSAFHKRERKDYAEVLNVQYSGKYLHTIPADVADVSFEVGEPNISLEEQCAYVLQAGGVYTYANEETQRKAGDWVSKLDPEAQSFLQETYELYARSSRNASILS